MSVKAKKYLGQHFLTDEKIAKDIGDALTQENYKNVLEIGPGMGVLTKYLFEKDLNLTVIEVDNESVEYLKNNYINKEFSILNEDFLKIDLKNVFNGEPFAIIGNFPYNISSQILFKTLENKDLVPEFAGMFQKEVAERACAIHGNKTYGIVSVLIQAYYDTEYLFTVPEHVFSPPPKVKSGVMRMTRKKVDPACEEKMLFRVVKMAFQQRRKTLRNSLKALQLEEPYRSDPIFNKRPEQLSVDEFINLTVRIQEEIK